MDAAVGPTFFLLAQIKPFQERKANSFDNKHALSPAAEQSRVPGLCLETLNWRIGLRLR